MFALVNTFIKFCTLRKVVKKLSIFIKTVAKPKYFVYNGYINGKLKKGEIMKNREIF